MPTDPCRPPVTTGPERREKTMTRAGLDAARASTAQLADIVPLVNEEAWNMPSACAGWRVIDVNAHLGALAHEAAEPQAPDRGARGRRQRPDPQHGHRLHLLGHDPHALA
ncbi:maleylpyruvate isomerase N-terminal domain-containing protein [Streptomyces sp. TG1A-8]|uniref:maleylpyruvate isomerase N-terminal domain-containing protein n=1 Tax=Streptomyces sp. TG1A-8 TaxID=3051385 RepID=UPI003464DA7F